VKHADELGCKALTGAGMAEFKRFSEALNKAEAKVWVRHVVIPGLTDSAEHLQKIKQIAKGFKNLHKIELLPYQLSGMEKYQEMGIPYGLAGVPPMDEKKVREMEYLLNHIP